MPRARLTVAACVLAFLEPWERGFAGVGLAAGAEPVRTEGAAGASAAQLDALPDLPDGFHLDIDSITMALGSHHTCALEYRPGVDFGGPVRCWGSDDYGQGSAPQGLFMQLGAGRRHSCGVRTDQTLACWGSSPWAPEGLWQQVSVGAHHTCALSTDGLATCWGSDISGTVHPPATVKFVQLSAGADVSCGITTTGLVRCWGSDFRGQATPPRGVRFRQISASPTQHVCGVTLEGDLVCWGRNHGGEGVAHRPGPWKQVSCGQWRTCAIRGESFDGIGGGGGGDFGGDFDGSDDSDGSAAKPGVSPARAFNVPGSIVCWGEQILGPSIPVAEAQDKYDEISTSDYHSCAVTSAGELRCWGDHRVDRGSSRVPEGFEAA
ncbi:unnamed protein product [Phaeothamnion confervicola]